MSALSAMQDKTQHLENSLSAETRIKLDLFSALGDAKRQLEIAQGSRNVDNALITVTPPRIVESPHLTCVSVFRSDPSEGPGDQRPEAEDSRSDGRHAQHLLHSRHQQHDPRGPPLLLKVHGHQSLRPGPQRFCLPAPQKVKALSRPSIYPPNIFTFPQLHHLVAGNSFVLFSPRQVRRKLLYCVTVFVVVKTKDKKKQNLKNGHPTSIRKRQFFGIFFLFNV